MEKEIFPAIAKDKQLHAMDLEGFWMDVGQPKDYLSGTCLYLSYISSLNDKRIVDPRTNPWVHKGNVMVDPVSARLLSFTNHLSLIVFGEGGRANRLRCGLLVNRLPRSIPPP